MYLAFTGTNVQIFDMVLENFLRPAQAPRPSTLEPSTQPPQWSMVLWVSVLSMAIIDECAFFDEREVAPWVRTKACDGRSGSRARSRIKLQNSLAVCQVVTVERILNIFHGILM